MSEADLRDYMPTHHLRFVERDEECQPSGETPKLRRVRVLQQLYISPWGRINKVWRDVPLVIETPAP